MTKQNSNAKSRMSLIGFRVKISLNHFSGKKFVTANIMKNFADLSIVQSKLGSYPTAKFGHMPATTHHI